MIAEKDETKLEKCTSCKVLSKVAMVLSGVWIISTSVIKGFGKFNLSVKEIVFVGIALVVVWSPAYLSIHLDKIKDKLFE